MTDITPTPDPSVIRVFDFEQVEDGGYRFRIEWKGNHVTSYTTMANTPERLQRVVDKIIRDGSGFSDQPDPIPNVGQLGNRSEQ